MRSRAAGFIMSWGMMWTWMSMMGWDEMCADGGCVVVMRWAGRSVAFSNCRATRTRCIRALYCGRLPVAALSARTGFRHYIGKGKNSRQATQTNPEHVSQFVPMPALNPAVSETAATGCLPALVEADVFEIQRLAVDAADRRGNPVREFAEFGYAAGHQGLDIFVVGWAWEPFEFVLLPGFFG